jgi:spore germination protein YaaH
MGAILSAASAAPAQAGVASPRTHSETSAATSGPASDVSSAAAAPAAAAPKALAYTASAKPSREVFGFALASSLADPTVGYPSWNFDALSTVAFFGVHVDTAGHFVGDSGWNVWNSSALTSLVSIAHQHGVHVVLTIVLQDFSANTPDMCAGLAHADATVAQTASEIRAKGVDGVNIDYEGLDGSCGSGDPYWAQHAMTALAQKMRAALGASTYISIDTYSGAAGDPYGFFDIGGLGAYVDSMFVMAYDMEYSNYSSAPLYCSSFCLGPTSPLTGYRYNDTAVMSQYVAAVPASKVILGVPYYGRKACVGSATLPNQYPTSSVVADSYLDASGEAAYFEVKPGSYAVHRDTHSAGMERWDTWYNTTLGCTRELYWDDAVSLGKKYDLVNSDALRGVGIWNLNYGGGAPELWAALQSHFVGCTGAAVTASPVSPQWTWAHVTVTATSSGCSNPQYRFWIQPPGGGWTVVQGYSAGNTYSWAAPGVPGTYRIEADVRGSTAVSYDSYSVISDVLRACSSVGVSTSPGPPALPGATVVVTGSSSCPGTPEYRFWVQPPGGKWAVVQSYSTAVTYSWTGQLQGTYGLQVDVRDQGSNAYYDKYVTATFTRYAPPCSTPSLNALPTSPRGSGTQVAFSASSSACPNPRYRFWIEPPGGGWKIVQDYSAASSFMWTTTGAAGTYGVEVDVRDASSTAPYDHVANSTYVLTSCSGARLSTNIPSPQPIGSTIVLSGSASCLSTPTFRFWVRDLTGRWTIVRDYSTVTTFSWNTTGLADGVYGLEVDARDLGSTAPYETVANLNFLVDTCSSARLATSKASPQAPGVPVVLTATSSCMGTAEYRFWVRDLTGRWTIVQDYSATSTFTWNTSREIMGTYGLEVDVRNHGSLAVYESVANLTFTLYATPCTAAHLVTDKASGQAPGTVVTLTGSATCGGAPQYRFWVRDLTGRWTIVQDFSSATTCAWNTTGLPAGTYGLEVDVRNLGSSVPYQTVANLTFRVT